MSQIKKTDLEGWHRNSELCIDLKTVLRTDYIAGFGKQYQGQLTRDSEDHFSFLETLPSTDGKRNPRLFEGRHITLTRRADGYIRLNFKPLKRGPGFTVDGYALAVCNELRQALKGLVEERPSE